MFTQRSGRRHRRTHPLLELGGTEDSVNRIKKIKRRLYGRAEFELLRKMILLQ
jgi:transposase